MVVGICTLELRIRGAMSLKEKRWVLKSLQSRIGQRFGVSIAETDFQDKWQRAELGIAKVSLDYEGVDKTFDSIGRLIESDGRVEVVRADVEYA